MISALQTSPNAAVPAGLRKKLVSADTATSGHAAGILFVAPDGDVLVCRRAPGEANYGGHWALPGGKAEDGESPEQAASREAAEELGAPAEGPMKLLDRQITPTGMSFSTFVRPIAEKFQPKLNLEHVGYAWAPLDQLPQPLHPGVAATLKDRLDVAGDMTPEDWGSLRSGFLKWTLEEEAEGEHADDEIKNQEIKANADGVATDSALTLALDRDSTREFDQDGRMRVKVAHISKACVNPYKGHEIPKWQELGLDPNRVYYLLRDPDELAKAAPTFNGIQILRKHVPVSADDHQPWDIVGTTATDAKFVSPYLDNGLVIWARDAIDGIESDMQKELSSGYHYRAEMTPGEFDGMRYDGVMRDIRGNHVALVKDGRAGPDVVVGDSNQEIKMADNREIAKTLAALAARQVSIGALSAYLRPRLAKPHIAMDSKPLGIMSKVFEGVTGANFKDMKPKIAARIREQTKGKLAQDASLDDVEKVLDMLDGHEVDAGDASVSEAQHGAMEAAAHGNSTIGIPEKVGKEFVSKDATEGLRGFLKEKGMGEDDISTALGMMPKPATDEDPDEKKKREAEEAEKKTAADKAAKDAEMEKKDMVTKPAMDEAIKAASDATAKRVRGEERAIREAEKDVLPFVGEIAIACDSAEEVYRTALGILGVPEAKTIHASALKTVLNLQPKAGARETSPAKASLAMDAATQKSFAERFPDAARIGRA